MINFCVSLTSLPSRIDNISETIQSIENQTLKPNKVFLNLPLNFKRFPEYNFTTNQISKLSKYNLEISRCEDYGPATKLMGSLNKINKEYDCVILIDDDHIYHERVFEIFIDNFKKEKVNYSYYMNKIFNIRNGQCSDGFLINVKLLDEIEDFYEKYVKKCKNMFLDDDLWLAIYLQKEKNSFIKNLKHIFYKKTNKKVVYKQNENSKINSLYLNEHKDGFILNRRKIQKIEYIKYLIKTKIFSI